MKMHYYPETDSLYIDLADRPGADSREVAPGIVLDFDKDGKLVGIDIDQASQIVNLTRLEAEALPIVSVSLSREQDDVQAARLGPAADRPAPAG